MSLDIKLTESGDITIPTRRVTGEDLVIQRCRIRTETWFGEWILDRRVGVPWARWLQETPAPLTQIEDFFRAEYGDVTGVRKADVTAEIDDDLTILIDAKIYIDQRDEPSFALEAAVAPDQPAVISIYRTAGIL